MPLPRASCPLARALGRASRRPRRLPREERQAPARQAARDVAARVSRARWFRRLATPFFGCTGCLRRATHGERAWCRARPNRRPDAPRRRPRRRARAPWQRREPSQGPPSSRVSSGRGWSRSRSVARATHPSPPDLASALRPATAQSRPPHAPPPRPRAAVLRAIPHYVGLLSRVRPFAAALADAGPHRGRGRRSTSYLRAAERGDLMARRAARERFRRKTDFLRRVFIIGHRRTRSSNDDRRIPASPARGTLAVRRTPLPAAMTDAHAVSETSEVVLAACADRGTVQALVAVERANRSGGD